MPISSSDRVAQLIKSMSLPEKVGQIFVFTWENEQQAVNDLRLHPGGFVRIYSDAFSVARQTRTVQQHSPLPLIIAADFERGIGGTIGGPLETVTCMALGATGSEQAAFDAARMIGEEAAAIGINMNYAPVLDVNNNPANPVINTRSFGGDPELVARLSVAFARGLRSAGIAACGKHFPGHGNTHVDSHSQLGCIESTLEELEAIELVPFRALIADGVDAIMSAHLHVPCLEPENIPATVSRNIMTGLLRDKLGFTGVAISDAMEMKAVSGKLSAQDAIPMAINAGCDQLIMPEDNALAVASLLQAVKAGVVTEARIDEAVTRILTMKVNRGILDAPLPSVENIHESIYVPQNISRAREIATESITLVKDEGVLPLRPGQESCCIVISNGDDGHSRFLEPRSFPDFLKATGVHAKTIKFPADQPDKEADAELQLAVKAADVIVIAAYVNVRLNSGTIDLPAGIVAVTESLFQLGKPVILASFGSPYLINQLSGAGTYLCAYSATQPSQFAMAEAIAGRAPVTGKLPVSLAQA